VHQIPHLTENDIAVLLEVERNLPVMADLSRADVLMYGELQDLVVVLAQAQPHSIAPIYLEDLTGRTASQAQKPRLLRTLRQGRRSRGTLRLIPDGAPVVQEVHPVFNERGRVIAAVSIETNFVAHERHRRRSPVFRRALRDLQEMILHRDLKDAEGLIPFRENDGIVVVNARGQIGYVSGIAANLYRRLGHMENLVGRAIGDLGTGDARMVASVALEGRCLQEEIREGSRIWIRRGLPLLSRPGWLAPLRGWLRQKPLRSHFVGVMLTLRDVTEERQQEQELKIKSTMIQEVHHRVKNNLQTIAALLRMQARRAKSEETRQALEDGINRILSVAVVHEFLSRRESAVINMREVSQQILTQTRQSILDPNKDIQLELNGPNIYLPTRQATACALIINELLQNAVEHGYRDQSVGRVSLALRDEGDQVVITVWDDGQGLPAGFRLDETDSLGLQIVQTLVQDDLKGKFEIHENEGVSAIVSFPKETLGGGKNWKKPE